MAWKVHLLDPAARDLARLDRPLQRRIVERVWYLAEHVDAIRPEALVGDWAGFCKLRAGAYRVIYQLLHDERMILIHTVGHRRDVYRKR